jgi:hypothetical protein
MKFSDFYSWRTAVVLSALMITAAHWGRADVKLMFSEGPRSGAEEYVQLIKSETDPVRYKMSRCSASGCAGFGNKSGYLFEEIEERVYSLSGRREEGHLSTLEDHQLDMLSDLVQGIESPKIQWKNRVCTYNVKGSVDQFVKTVEEQLN